MIKKGTFKKVSFSLERLSAGDYLLTSCYRRKNISVRVHDSEIWDFLDDDSEPEKQQDARRACYRSIKAANY